jgi:hypothetical protein
MRDSETYTSNTLLNPNGEGIKVQARRFDDVDQDLGIASIDFLKTTRRRQGGCFTVCPRLHLRNECPAFEVR